MSKFCLKHYKDFRNIFENFIFALEHIKNFAIYDKYNREMPIINLSGNCSLSSFLIDDYYCGNYLDRALENFIELQNGFLNELFIFSVFKIFNNLLNFD